MDNAKLINDNFKKQTDDLIRVAKFKGYGITETQALKHKYMKRTLSLYYLGMYAEKYGDGTDQKLFVLSRMRKKYYINKLIN